MLVGNYGIITYNEKANAFAAAYNAVQFEEDKAVFDLCYAGQPVIIGFLPRKVLIFTITHLKKV